MRRCPGENEKCLGVCQRPLLQVEFVFVEGWKKNNKLSELCLSRIIECTPLRRSLHVVNAGHISLSWILKMNGGSPENTFLCGLLTSDKWCQLYNFSQRRQTKNNQGSFHPYICQPPDPERHTNLRLLNVLLFGFIITAPYFLNPVGSVGSFQSTPLRPCFEAVGTGKNVYKHSRWTN